MPENQDCTGTCAPLSGMNKDAAKQMWLGPGAVIVNYGCPDQFVLGTTRGGNSFESGTTFRQIESDNPFQNIKGFKVPDEIMPKLVTNLLSIGLKQLKLAIPGLKEEDAPITSVVQDEVIGIGDGTTTVFPLANPSYDRCCGFILKLDGVEFGGYQVLKPGDVGHSGGIYPEIVFTTAPATGVVITGSYTKDDNIIAVAAEAVGTGDGTTTIFALANKDIKNILVQVNATTGFTVLEPGDAGHSGGATAELKFDVAPPNTEAITADYTYQQEYKVLCTRLRQDCLSDGDYLKNIALVTTISGQCKPAVIVLKNVLSDGGISLSLANKDEGVLEITFTANFLPEDLEQFTLGNVTLPEIVPYYIEYPNVQA